MPSIRVTALGRPRMNDPASSRAAPAEDAADYLPSTLTTPVTNASASTSRPSSSARSAARRDTMRCSRSANTTAIACCCSSRGTGTSRSASDFEAASIGVSVQMCQGANSHSSCAAVSLGDAKPVGDLDRADGLVCGGTPRTSSLRDNLQGRVLRNDRVIACRFGRPDRRVVVDVRVEGLHRRRVPRRREFGAHRVREAGCLYAPVGLISDLVADG